ncbi:hypothetical protein BJ742DRAFT_739432 [Cladochytrium replicatum]|nr:hypothetical protein BJ742DRAFT_739432 [Cladochytrium replicatum]
MSLRIPQAPSGLQVFQLVFLPEFNSILIVAYHELTNSCVPHIQTWINDEKDVHEHPAIKDILDYFMHQVLLNQPSVLQQFADLLWAVGVVLGQQTSGVPPEAFFRGEPLFRESKNVRSKFSLGPGRPRSSQQYRANRCRAVGLVKFVFIDGLWSFGGLNIKRFRDSGYALHIAVTDNMGEPVLTKDRTVGNVILFTKTEASATGFLTEADYVTQSVVKDGAAPLECNTTESLVSEGRALVKRTNAINLEWIRQVDDCLFIDDHFDLLARSKGQFNPPASSQPF